MRLHLLILTAAVGIAVTTFGCGHSPPKLAKVDLASVGLDLVMDAPEGAKVKRETDKSIYVDDGKYFRLSILELDAPYDLDKAKKGMEGENLETGDNFRVLQVNHPQTGKSIHGAYWTTLDGRHFLCTDMVSDPADYKKEPSRFTRDDVAVMIQCARSVSVRPKESADPASQLPGEGKATPDEALDAYIAALKKKDEQAYRGLIANVPRGISDFETLVKSGMAGKAGDASGVLELTLSGSGMTEEHKRFPAEINGRKATIVLLVPENAFSKDLKYIKYDYIKGGDKWYFVGRTFGPQSKIDGKRYSWDRKKS